MALYDYPHTGNYDQDLGFLIKQYKDLINQYDKLNEKYDLLVTIYEKVKNDIKDITINQLEKWLEDGTLEQLVNKYIQFNRPIYFENVLEMKKYNELKENDYIITKGYYVSGDGGNAQYTVITQLNENDIVDDGSIIELSNNLYAQLIDKKINPKMFGAKATKDHNDLPAINNALNYCFKINVPLCINDMFYINDVLVINKNVSIIGSKYNFSGFTQMQPNRSIVEFNRPYQVDFKGLHFDNLLLTWLDLPYENTYGIVLRQIGDKLDGWGMHECSFDNLIITNAYFGIYCFQSEPIWNCSFKNLRINNCQYQCVFLYGNFGISMDLIALGNSKGPFNRTACIYPKFTGTLNLDVEDWDGYILQCDNAYAKLEIPHVHIERCAPKYNSLFYITGQYVHFGEITLYNVTFKGSITNLITYTVLSQANANLIVDHIFTLNTTLPDGAMMYGANIGGNTNQANLISIISCVELPYFKAYNPATFKENVFYKYKNIE